MGPVLLTLFTGCVGYVEGPRHARVYVQPPTVYVGGGVVIEDDYIYYPGYQVYYSGRRHEYIYQDGRSWVSHATPPHVSVDVLLAAPSVRVDFHDHPSIHHTVVARQYPKNWAPQNRGQSPSENHNRN